MLNNDPDVFPEQAPIIILDGKSSICMDNNGKYTIHTRHIFRRIHLVRNGEDCNFHQTVCCEGGMQMADVGIKNVREYYFNNILVYAMVRLDNW